VAALGGGYRAGFAVLAVPTAICFFSLIRKQPAKARAG
jgi:hypothetical protein